MGAHQVGGNGKAEARAAGAGGFVESLEQAGAQLLRHAWTGVGDFDHRRATLAPRPHADAGGQARCRAGGLQRLARITRQVQQHPEQMLGVSLQLKFFGHIKQKGNAALAARCQRLHHVIGHCPQHHAANLRRRLGGAAIGQR